MEIDVKLIESIVRKVLEEEAEKNEDKSLSGLRHVDKSGVMSINTNKVVCEKFPFPIPSNDVYLKDVLTLEESPRLGCGVMELKNGASLDWTLKYDEIDYVIEGRLEIIIDGRKVCASAGEIILIPKNSSITFSTPSETRFFYVVYPADWSNQ